MIRDPPPDRAHRHRERGRARGPGGLPRPRARRSRRRSSRSWAARSPSARWTRARCNGCELEIHALNNPYYNLEGLGIRFVASPRHADMLLVTGPVSKNMERALRIAYEATPDPKLVVAVGDCGCTGGIFGESYASCGKVANVIPVDVAVPGCPPPPIAILQGILTAVTARADGA